MPLLVRFTPASMTAEQYDQVLATLESRAQWPPDGLQVHVCFGSGSQLRVSEVWESREKMEAFAADLMPLLEEQEIDVASMPPEVLDVHNLALGAR